MKNTLSKKDGFVAPKATTQQGTTHSAAANPPDWQRHMLAAWLSEWQMELRLRQVDEVGEHQVPSELNRGQQQCTDLGIEPYDKQVTVGEVRLLSPCVVPETSRPVYVAVLSDWEAGMKLIAPYGRFSNPGSTGELLTGRTHHPLRVLCLWNCVSVPDEAIASGWKVDDLNAKEIEEAWAAFIHVLTGRPLPPTLIERIGPPICNSADPRCQYQQEELRVTARLATQALWFVETGKLRGE